MVRQFKLENENGKQFSLTDIKNYAFLESPTGLGYAYNLEFEQIGDIFVNTLEKIQQSNIEGNLFFKSYENYKKFIDYIETSSTIKLFYTVSLSNSTLEMYKDVKLASIEKAEIDKTTGYLICPVVFVALSLWQEKSDTVFVIEPQTDELRWDFRWDARSYAYNNRKIIFENKGHAFAPVVLEISGHVINPKLEITRNGEIYGKLELNLTLQEHEKLLYSSKDNDLYILKQNVDGTQTNLFDLLDINNNNFLKIPFGTYEIRITADNNITNAKISIITQRK